MKVHEPDETQRNALDLIDRIKRKQMEQTFLIAGNRSEIKNMLKEIISEVLHECNGTKEHNSKRVLSIGEAAEFLKLKISTLYEKTATRIIPHFKKGNRLYFLQTDLEEWLIQGKVKMRREIQQEAATLTMNGHRYLAS